MRTKHLPAREQSSELSKEAKNISLDRMRKAQVLLVYLAIDWRFSCTVQ